jgi:bacterioferritin-associated ferredoxin
MDQNTGPTNIFRAVLRGRDLIEISVTAGKARIHAIGCGEVLQLIRQYLKDHGEDCATWPEPSGHSHGELLLREALLKMRGEWKLPYGEDELCHCRAVPTEVVDQAIVAGAHDTATVSRWTSASTSCGTCRPDVQSLIDYRLKKVSAAG